MTWSALQTNTATGSTNGSTVTTTGSVTAGDLLLLAVHQSGASAATFTITDTQSNTWAPVVSQNAQGNVQGVLYWCKAAATGLLTVTFASTVSGAWEATIVEFQAAAASPVDQTAKSTWVSSAAPSVGPTGALAVTGELVVGFAFSAVNTAGSWTIPTGYTDIHQIGGSRAMDLCWTTAAGTSAVTATWGSSPEASGDVVVATFKPAGGTAWTAAPTETVTATDTVARVFVGARQNTETATTSDTPNRVQVLLRLIAESSIVTDLGNRVGVFKRQDAESAATTDGAARQAGYARQDAESTTETDTASRRQTLARESDEQGTTSDQPNRVQQLLRAIAETVQTLDSAAASVGHGATDWVVSAAESVLASDLVQRALTLGRNTPETTAETDTTARQTDLGRATQEATGGADDAGRSVSAQRSVDDATTAQDVPGRIHGVIAAVAETLSNSDTLSHAASLLRTIAEALHVTDLVSAIIGRRYRPSGQGMVLTPLPHAMTLTALPPAELTLPAQPFALTLTPRS